MIVDVSAYFPNKNHDDDLSEQFFHVIEFKGNT